MPFTRLYAHLVWSTKDRAPSIDPLWEDSLYRCLCTSIERSGAKVLAIGGITDHVHVLVQFGPSLRLSELVANLKGSSSHFVSHELHPDYDFAWQRGYFVASVSEKDLTGLAIYIEKQKAHHAEQIMPHWEP